MQGWWLEQSYISDWQIQFCDLFLTLMWSCIIQGTVNNLFVNKIWLKGFGFGVWWVGLGCSPGIYLSFILGKLFKLPSHSVLSSTQ